MAKNETTVSRDKIIIRTSIIGVIANVLLAAFKATVGILSSSIAIVLDAVNNLTDALSSVITIVGTKIAGKAPDRKHPLGHGRVEYLTAMIISVLVLYAGITAFVESIKNILDPATPSYTTPSLIIVAVAVVVKLLLGGYVKSVGEKVNSGSLVASGQDARMDSIISASTLIAALIFIKTGISLEAWLGLLISILIIKTGVELLRETLSQIIGERVDSDLSQTIKEIISDFPDVSGAYDLILHSYGPDSLMGSVHIEIPDTYTATKIDRLTREIQKKVYEDTGVFLTAGSIYSQNTGDQEAQEIKDKINRAVMSHPEVVQTHGFYLDKENAAIAFDIILSFDCDREAKYREIYQEIAAMYPDYSLQIIMDTDISD